MGQMERDTQDEPILWGWLLVAMFLALKTCGFYCPESPERSKLTVDYLIPSVRTPEDELDHTFLEN